MLFKRLVAEALGTFILVFAGTGAIVIDTVQHGAVSHVGVALTFGLVVMVLVFALGDVCGAHFNCAVTIGFWTSRRFSGKEVAPYILAQLAGAFAASLLLKAIFPESSTLGETLPVGTALQSFVLETLLTFILMFVILNISTGANEKGLTAAIAVGGVIGLEALFAGPICGASMNPARSLAPALVSGHLEHLWVYLAGPVLGAVAAKGACACVRPPGCCCAVNTVKESCS